MVEHAAYISYPLECLRPTAASALGNTAVLDSMPVAMDLLVGTSLEEGSYLHSGVALRRLHGEQTGMVSSNLCFHFLQCSQACSMQSRRLGTTFSTENIFLGKRRIAKEEQQC